MADMTKEPVNLAPVPSLAGEGKESTSLVSNLSLADQRKVSGNLTSSLWEEDTSAPTLFRLRTALHTFWLLTESDLCTFVVPDTLFGIIGALSGPVLTNQPAVPLLELVWRVPFILAFPWLNVVVFELANQRLSENEDALNKPWRPIPSRRLTSSQMRHFLMLAIPAVLALTYLLHTWQETALLFALTWMYNDLGGGDEDFLVRNFIISVAFALYNTGALRVACGTECEINSYGLRWVALTSAVIFCTMQVQDLQDQAGDRAKGRRSAPLILGDRKARWTVAVPVLVFSILCPLYVGVSMMAYALPCGLGLLIIIRLFLFKKPKDDKKTWLIWAIWMIGLYFLPLMKS